VETLVASWDSSGSQEYAKVSLSSRADDEELEFDEFLLPPSPFRSPEYQNGLLLNDCVNILNVAQPPGYNGLDYVGGATRGCAAKDSPPSHPINFPVLEGDQRTAKIPWRGAGSKTPQTPDDVTPTNENQPESFLSQIRANIAMRRKMAGDATVSGDDVIGIGNKVCNTDGSNNSNGVVGRSSSILGSDGSRGSGSDLLVMVDSCAGRNVDIRRGSKGVWENGIVPTSDRNNTNKESGRTHASVIRTGQESTL